MNTYLIPKENRSTQEYFEYVSNLNFVYVDDRSLVVNPSSEEVSLNGTIAGFTQVN